MLRPQLHQGLPLQHRTAECRMRSWADLPTEPGPDERCTRCCAGDVQCHPREAPSGRAGRDAASACQHRPGFLGGRPRGPVWHHFTGLYGVRDLTQGGFVLYACFSTRSEAQPAAFARGCSSAVLTSAVIPQAVFRGTVTVASGRCAENLVGAPGRSDSHMFSPDVCTCRPTCVQLHRRLSALLEELVAAQHQERLAAKVAAAASPATGTDDATPARDQPTRSAARMRL